MKRVATLLFICGLLLTPSLPAQDSATKPENTSASGSTASENAPPEKDLSGWLLANFVVLVVALGYLGVKFGSPYFRSQSQEIVRGLDEARQQRTEAEIRANEVNRKLDHLGEDIELLRKNILAEQAAHAEQTRHRAEIEIERVHANALQQIEIAGKQARLELQRYASRLALELAEQRARQRMSPEIQRVLTNQFVESLRA